MINWFLLARGFIYLVSLIILIYNEFHQVIPDYCLSLHILIPIYLFLNYLKISITKQ